MNRLRAMLFRVLLVFSLMKFVSSAETEIDAGLDADFSHLKSAPPWALKLINGFKALESKVQVIDEEQKRMHAEERDLAASQKTQSKLQAAIERSEKVAGDEKTSYKKIQRWRHHQVQHRHNRHRDGGLDSLNRTTALSTSCPRIRTGKTVFVNPVLFSVGYYVDVSIASEPGPKIRVGHMKSLLFDLHSTMYLTDVHGQVRTNKHLAKKR